MIKYLLQIVIVLFVSGCATGSMIEERDFPMPTDNSQQNDVVFLHGYGGSKCSWLLVAEQISERYNASFIEMPGFGEQAPPPGFDYTVESQARHLSNMISDGLPEDLTIVAYSYGAAVLFVSMLDYGVKPKKVILIDPLAYSQELPFFIKVQNIPVLWPLISRLVPPRVQVDIVLNAVYAPSSTINETMRNCYVSEFRHPFHRRALSETASVLSSFEADRYVSRYGELSAEFHIIWGEDDPLLSVDFAGRLHSDISAESLSIIEGCGHAPHEECPERFLEVLFDVLER